MSKMDAGHDMLLTTIAVAWRTGERCRTPIRKNGITIYVD